MITESNSTHAVHDEYPSAADLRAEMRSHPLPTVVLKANPLLLTADDGGPAAAALTVLGNFQVALDTDDAAAVESCFFPGQAYWRDALAFTWHLRTFMSPPVIAASLLETKAQRGLDGSFRLDTEIEFLPIAPTLPVVAFGFVYKTKSPAAKCKGRMMLLPVEQNGTLEWKIWILTTWLESLDLQPENKLWLWKPGRAVNGLEHFETEVLIVGGGNSAVTLAARLKALGVESIMVERNASPGDNWALRYDFLRFHVPTSMCEMPYMHYEKHLRSPHLLTRDDLADQVRRYVRSFRLNMVTSARIQSITFDQVAERWVVRFQTPDGMTTATSKHLVQATGFASRIPYVPPVSDASLYKGIILHTASYRNAVELRDGGVETVLVVGSANTAFDVLEDCYAAGLQVTMIARSPTYIMPVEDVCDKRFLGAYDYDAVEGVDERYMTMPTWVDAQLGQGLLRLMALEKPDRYTALAATGFPVIDGRHPDACLPHNLLERAGGHYVDIGGTDLIVEGKAGFKAGVEPVAYTATGLRFSDGSHADADAVVWCTGYTDKNARDTAAEILGTERSENMEHDGAATVLGPSEIAARLDATWGVDAEGEIRGMWKRQSRLKNYWIMGGGTHLQRWHSRTLALQIKAELEGILPPAYLHTPELRDIKE